MMPIIGTVGALLLGLCGFPQLLKTLRTGEAHSFAWGFLGMWWIGELLSLAYVIHLDNLILALNYTTNVVVTSVLTYYKLFPRIER